MSTPQTLTPNDTNVLTHLFDPESPPPTTNSTIQVDASLPSDPHIRDPTLLQHLKTRERAIIASIEAAYTSTSASASQSESQPPNTSKNKLPTSQFQTLYATLGALISHHPTYASARNNRAQLIRLQFGDNILGHQPRETPEPEAKESTTAEASEHKYATTALEDLNTAIALLTPPTPGTAMSPSQHRTLAQAHMQRGALYHAAAKTLSSPDPRLSSTTNTPTPSTDAYRTAPGLDTCTPHELATSASTEFALGGRYGNEIGRALAVSTNPTAKLCGEMVREAMRREYEPAFRQMSG